MIYLVHFGNFLNTSIELVEKAFFVLFKTNIQGFVSRLHACLTEFTVLEKNVINVHVYETNIFMKVILTLFCISVVKPGFHGHFIFTK